MTQPYDVNAAREQRIQTPTWDFRLDGQTYRLPTEMSRDIARKLRQLDDKDVDGLLRLLLGDEQYARFNEHEITMQDIAALLEAYGKGTGLGGLIDEDTDAR